MNLTHQKVIESNHLSIKDYDFADPITIGLAASKYKSSQLTLSSLEGELSTFLSRIGFYKYLGILDPHKIPVRDASKTIELCTVPDGNDTVLDRVRTLINHPTNSRTIELLLVELMDNCRHSQGEALVLGQVINKKIHLAIVDNGVGIFKTLSSNPDYSKLDERECILRSVEKGVTCGTGRGYGLWSAHEVISQNKGELLIGSGNHEFSLKNYETAKIHHWQGTYVALEYNLETPVDYSQVTGLAKDAKVGLSYEDNFPF